MNRFLVGSLLAALFLCAGVSFADTFGSGANSFDIEFVTIGNPGNPADTTGSPSPAGSVPYEYRIGKYEIPEQMIDKANAIGALGITKFSRGPDLPVTDVTWHEAARFVNWLNISTGSVPAYKYDDSGDFQLWTPSDAGYDPNNLYRNKLATYFLPSVHEWYKAAYYDPATGAYYDFPTGSNIPPTPVASGTTPGTAVYQQGTSAGPAEIMSAGGLSPYGTMAQGGNVTEWMETATNLANNALPINRIVRGGAWYDSSFELQADFQDSLPAMGNPVTSLGNLGFRVASITPEPCGTLLFGIGVFGTYGVLGRAWSARRYRNAKSLRALETMLA